MHVPTIRPVALLGRRVRSAQTSTTARQRRRAGGRASVRRERPRRAVPSRLSPMAAHLRSLIGWIGLVLSIVAVFIGGAGIVMIVAGQVNAAAVSLAAASALGGVYTGWFLYRGPGRFSAIETELPSHPAPASLATATSRVPQPLMVPLSSHRSICWFCGTRERTDNRLIWGDRAAICEQCARSASGMGEREPTHAHMPATEAVRARRRSSR